MESKVIVQKKNVYGNELIYPVCEKAKLLAKISDTETLTRKVIDSAKKLGFVFELKTDKEI